MGLPIHPGAAPWNRIARAAIACIVAIVFAPTADAAVITWTGSAATDNWSLANNWSAGIPGSSDTALFGQAGSVALPDTVTNFLDADHTVAGLAYQFGNAFHTTVLGGFTLTVRGNLNVNTDVGSTGSASIRNGMLVLDDPLSSINVARSFQANAVGTLNLGGLSSLNAKVNTLQVGTTASGLARGTLTLAASNTIDARSIDVGRSAIQGQDGIGTLLLGASNVILADEFNISRDNSTGIVTLPAGGSLQLASAVRPAALTVGRLDRDTNADGRLDVSAGVFNAFLSDLTVAQKASAGNNLRGTVLGGNSGDIRIGTTEAPGNIRIGYQISGGSSSTGIVDFSRQSSLVAHLNQMSVGFANPQGLATGTFSLAANNTIVAKKIEVGVNGERQNQLTLGRVNNIQADEFLIGAGSATGVVTLSAGGSLVLGSETRPTRLSIGNGILTNSQSFEGRLELNGNEFQGFLDGALIVGQREGAPGATTGTFKAGNGGSLVLGKTANSADLIVGRGRGGGTGVGLADFSGLATFNASVNQLHVGHATGGRGRGVLHLADANTIDAKSIVVGRADSASNPQQTSENSGVVTLGATNTIVTDELLIGRDLSSAAIQFRGGGSLNLGTATRRASLSIGTLSAAVTSSWESRMDLTGGSFNGFLRDVIVGQKTGGSGTISATILAGNNGNVSIGEPMSPSNLLVGTSADGGVATGVGDFSGLSSMSANLNQLHVGVANQGQARGTLHLPTIATIDAKSIVVGTNILLTTEPNLVTLGTTTNILADEFAIGRNHGNGTVRVRAGGTLNLGAAARRTNLAIGQSNTSSISVYEGRLDLGAADFHGFVENLIVAEANGASGATFGRISGGNGGSLNIGSPGNKASFLVGRSVNGGGATGLVDLSTLDSLTANLNQLRIGTAATHAGNAYGALILPKSATIDAKSIVVGEFGNNDNLLRLGADTTILTDELIVAKQRSHARIEMPAGAIFRLGSPSRPANLTIADIVFDTGGSFFHGDVNLSGGTFVANLNNVVVGRKDIQEGGVNGWLTIGPSSANSVHANRISLGIGPGIARGTLIFRGGLLAADVIERGTATGAFHWDGGTLRVNSFGNGAQLFDLHNLGTGRLSPGDPIATTNIRGNYLQGRAAAAQIDVGGTTPGIGHDQVNILGSTILGGTLDVRLIGGFAPVLGNAFDLFTFDSRTGVFDNVLFPVLPGSAAFQLDYSQPTKVTLRMVTPQSLQWVAAAQSGSWSNSANWSGGSVPTTISDALLSNSSASEKQAVLDVNSTVHRVTIAGASATMGVVVPSDRTLLATDRIVIEQGGRLDLLQGKAISSAIELAGGTLRGHGVTATPVVVQQGTIDVPDPMQALTLEGPVTIAATGTLSKIGAGELNVSGSLLNGGNVTVASGTIVAPAARLTSLTLAAGSTFRVRPASDTSVLGSLAIAGANDAWTAKLDVTNSDAVIQSSAANKSADFARLYNQLKQGFDNATWQGLGITSSTAATNSNADTGLALVDNALFGLATFSGQTVTSDSILLKYTYYGDIDQNGQVDADDLTVFANNFGRTSGAKQIDGDIDFNGAVNADDLTVFANNFNKGVGNPIANGDVQEVPEPSGIALLGIAVATLIGIGMRRQWKQRIGLIRSTDYS